MLRKVLQWGFNGVFISDKTVKNGPSKICGKQASKKSQMIRSV